MYVCTPSSPKCLDNCTYLNANPHIFEVRPERPSATYPREGFPRGPPSWVFRDVSAGMMWLRVSPLGASRLSRTCFSEPEILYVVFTITPTS